MPFERHNVALHGEMRVTASYLPAMAFMAPFFLTDKTKLRHNWHTNGRKFAALKDGGGRTPKI